jgi:MoaA/NifB/PqqE/SkfB family radical SAM enzyme
MSAHVLRLADAARLLGDADHRVRTAAGQLFRRGAAATSPSQLCAALWSVTTSDDPELVAPLVRLLDHPDANVRRLAIIGLRGLHPLLGLPSRCVRTASNEPGTGMMQDWLVPRESFERSLGDFVQRGDFQPDLLAASLAEFAGERERVARVLAHTPAETLLRASTPSSPRQLIVALGYYCSRQCPYCYARSDPHVHRGPMRWHAALRALDWARDEGATLVSFTGGEPTEHPLFPELVDQVERRGLRLYVTTHGLAEGAAFMALTRRAVVNVGLHLANRDRYRPAELDRLRRNADLVQRAGVEVFVRYTLWRGDDDDPAWPVSFAGQIGARHLHIAAAFPDLRARNHHLDAEQLRLRKPSLLRLFALAGEHGIRVRMAKPLPLCLFARTEYAGIQRQHELASTCTVHERGGIHNMVVNPDLRTYPCVGLPHVGPVLGTGDRETHQAHCQRHIDRALATLQSACADCALVELGVCQRACLAHSREVLPAPGPRRRPSA